MEELKSCLATGNISAMLIILFSVCFCAKIKLGDELYFFTC